MDELGKAYLEIKEYERTADCLLMKELDAVYAEAAAECEKRIERCNWRIQHHGNNAQGAMFQRNIQTALKQQLDGARDGLDGRYPTVKRYLEETYKTRWAGALYQYRAQGIPVLFPFSEERVLIALTAKSKLTHSMERTFDMDAVAVERRIRELVAESFINSERWYETAERIAAAVDDPLRMSLKRSRLIARTEGHRVQSIAGMDCARKCTDAGAKTFQRWLATMDGRTRDTHRALDGQVRAEGEMFEINGHAAAAPGLFGIPSEDCNCRCDVQHLARWMANDDELSNMKDRADYFGINKTKNFEDFRERFMEINPIL